jgi:hypothetical protein
MTFGAEREGVAKKIPPTGCNCAHLLGFEVTDFVSPLTEFWLAGVPRKDMNVSYFAETKGLVGCHYAPRLALKVR